jgi:hypothetical protein
VSAALVENFLPDRFEVGIVFQQRAIVHAGGILSPVSAVSPFGTAVATADRPEPAVHRADRFLMRRHGTADKNAGA